MSWYRCVFACTDFLILSKHLSGSIHVFLFKRLSVKIAISYMSFIYPFLTTDSTDCTISLRTRGYTSYIVSNLIWQLIVIAPSAFLLCQLSAAADNVQHNYSSFLTQWSVLSIPYLIELLWHTFSFLFQEPVPESSRWFTVPLRGFHVPIFRTSSFLLLSPEEELL